MEGELELTRGIFNPPEDDRDPPEDEYVFPDFFDEEANNARFAHLHPEHRKELIVQLQELQLEMEASQRVDEALDPALRPARVTTATSSVRLTVRLPRDLNDDLRLLVSRSGFSVNTFIVAALSRIIGESLGRRRP